MVATDFTARCRTLAEGIHQGRRLHALLTPMMDRTLASREEISLTEFADIIYLSQELSKLINDIRKRLDKLAETGKLVCATKIAARNINATDVSELDTSCRGEIASLTADIKPKPSVPHPKKDGGVPYREMLTALGVTEEFIEAGFLDLHYKRFMDYFAELHIEGKEYPFEVDVTWIPTASVRRKGDGFMRLLAATQPNEDDDYNG